VWPIFNFWKGPTNVAVVTTQKESSNLYGHEFFFGVPESERGLPGPKNTCDSMAYSAKKSKKTNFPAWCCTKSPRSSRVHSDSVPEIWWPNPKTITIKKSPIFLNFIIQRYIFSGHLFPFHDPIRKNNDYKNKIPKKQ
jgi:hypothetical protein